MKKMIIGILGLLMAFCLSSCSKDEAEAKESLLSNQEISGVWQFREAYTIENTENHGEPFHYADVCTEDADASYTSTEDEQLDMLYQILVIDADGHFSWEKTYYYPHRWRKDNTWGEQMDVYFMEGKVERTEDTLQFFSIKSTDIGFIGRVFTYELSADHKLLILHPWGEKTSQGPKYSLHFYKAIHSHD